jgi:hypothetical protein
VLFNDAFDLRDLVAAYVKEAEVFVHHTLVVVR